MGNLAYEVTNGEYTPLSVCQEFYRNGSIDPGSETFNIDPHIEKGAVHLFIHLSFMIKHLPPPCASIVLCEELASRHGVFMPSES